MRPAWGIVDVKGGLETRVATVLRGPDFRLMTYYPSYWRTVGQGGSERPLLMGHVFVWLERFGMPWKRVMHVYGVLNVQTRDKLSLDEVARMRVAEQAFNRAMVTGDEAAAAAIKDMFWDLETILGVIGRGRERAVENAKSPLAGLAAGVG